MFSSKSSYSYNSTDTEPGSGPCSVINFDDSFCSFPIISCDGVLLQKQVQVFTDPKSLDTVFSRSYSQGHRGQSGWPVASGAHSLFIDVKAKLLEAIKNNIILNS